MLDVLGKPLGRPLAWNTDLPLGDPLTGPRKNIENLLAYAVGGKRLKFDVYIGSNHLMFSYWRTLCVHCYSRTGPSKGVPFASQKEVLTNPIFERKTINKIGPAPLSILARPKNLIRPGDFLVDCPHSMDLEHRCSSAS